MILRLKAEAIHEVKIDFLNVNRLDAVFSIEHCLRIVLFLHELPLALASGQGSKKEQGFSPILFLNYLLLNSSSANYLNIMPHIKVYIHFVWSTKNRIPHLNSPELRKKVWQHMAENAKSKGKFIDFVNGHADHCHCLVSLGVDQTIQKVINLIKGESSYWINKNNLTSQKFEWQNDYFAVSVSESTIDKVRDYIKNQEEHHRKKSFQEEYDEFLKKYNFKKFQNRDLG